MSTSVLGQIGTVANGLGSAVKNLYTAVPQANNLESQAKYRSAQEAQLRQAMMRADEAYEWRKNHMGDMAGAYAGIDPTKASNVSDAYLGANKIALLERAGVLRPGTTQNAVEQVNQAYQQINPSVSENASVTPPISALGKNGYVEAPKPDNQPVNDVQAFNDAIQNIALLEKGWNGRDIYGNANKYGYATNKVTGGGSIVDQEAHDSAVAYDQARAQKAIHDANKPYTTKRTTKKTRSSGGGGGAYSIVKKRYQMLKDAGIPANQWDAEYDRRWGNKRK